MQLRSSGALLNVLPVAMPLRRASCLRRRRANEKRARPRTASAWRVPLGTVRCRQMNRPGDGNVLMCFRLVLVVNRLAALIANYFTTLARRIDAMHALSMQVCLGLRASLMLCRAQSNLNSAKAARRSSGTHLRSARPPSLVQFSGRKRIISEKRCKAIAIMPAATLAELPSPEQVEAQIEKLFEGQPRGFPFGDFEVDDIMLPDGDDMDIPSDDDDAADEEDIQAESGFGSVIGATRSHPCPHPLCRCTCLQRRHH